MSFGPAFPIERRVPLRAPFQNRHWNAPAPLWAVAVPKDSQAQCDHLREAFDARESRRRSAKIIVIHRGMNTNILVLASNLSDHDLLARVAVLAGKEREATAELLAHLAELDTRPPSSPPKVAGPSSRIARRCFSSRRMPPVTASRRLGLAETFR